MIFIRPIKITIGICRQYLTEYAERRGYEKEHLVFMLNESFGGGGKPKKNDILLSFTLIIIIFPPGILSNRAKETQFYRAIRSGLFYCDVLICFFSAANLVDDRS